MIKISRRRPLITILLLAVTFILIFSTNIDTKAQDGWREIQNGLQGYKFRCPEDAVVTRYDPDGVLQIRLPPENATIAIQPMNSLSYIDPVLIDNFTADQSEHQIEIALSELDITGNVLNVEKFTGPNKSIISATISGSSRLVNLSLVSLPSLRLAVVFLEDDMSEPSLARTILESLEVIDSELDVGLEAVTPTASFITSLNVPHYYQNDSRWNCDQLGNCTTCANLPKWACKSQPSITTIGDAGCAITSYAMIFEYYNNSHFMTPLELDTCYTLNSEYGTISGCGQCGRTWTNLNQSRCKPSSVSYLGVTTSQSVVDSDLAAGYPLVGELPGHYVVLIGKSGTSYVVNDPVIGNPSTRQYSAFSRFIRFRGPIPQPDTTKPVTSISFSGTVGDNYWYKSYVTMNLTATDNQSGVASTQWSYDGASWVTYSGAVALSKTGLEVPVYFRSIDNAGNIENTKVARYNSDPFPPMNPNQIDSRCGALSGVWQNTCPSPNFLWSGASDSLSGLAGYEYFWGTNPSATSGTYTTVNNYAPPPPGQGEVYLRIRTKDRAGNFSNWQTIFTFRYDSGIPYGSLDINNGAAMTYMTLVNANLSATDSLSGVSHYRLRNADGVWGQWQPMSANGLWKLPELNRTNHKVEVQYQDKAGNVSVTSSKSIWLELYPPKPVSNLYVLGKSTTGSAGVISSSANYQMMGTLAQPSIIGSGETENISSDWGYWTRVGFISRPWLSNYLPLVER